MKFIHIADVHLGARPDRRCSWGELRKEEIWKTFRRLITQVRKEKPDLLLIAGDLFHTQPLSRDLKEVNFLFQTLHETKVVLIMGNHDHVRRDSVLRRFEWAENVTCLLGEKPEKVYYEELQTTVYGLSYHTNEIMEPLYDRMKADNTAGCHILLAHGGDAEHIPMDKYRMLSSGFDYIALGHIHKPMILAADKMAYAGALEPIDCNDIGKHGFIRGEYTDGAMHIEFVPFACREYVHLTVQSDPKMTDHAMRFEISHQIYQFGSDNLYRIWITGYRDPEITYHTQNYQDLGNIVDIKDETEPALNLDHIYKIHREDVCGRFIEKLKDGDGPVSEIRKKALLFGVQALLEENN